MVDQIEPLVRAYAKVYEVFEVDCRERMLFTLAIYQIVPRVKVSALPFPRSTILTSMLLPENVSGRTR